MSGQARKRTHYSIVLRNAFKDVGYPMNKASQRYYDMRQRCENPNHKLYSHYGARGIKVEMPIEHFLWWFVRKYERFMVDHLGKSPSVSRIDYDKGYAVTNLDLTTVGENTKELYERRGNPNPQSSKLDDIQCLTVHTFNGQARMLSDHYCTTFSAIRHIQKGRNRKDIYRVIK